MNSERPVVLVAGATGRTGRLVVEAADRHGLRPRALARNPDRARPLVPAAEIVQGDLEDLSTPHRCGIGYRRRDLRPWL